MLVRGKRAHSWQLRIHTYAGAGMGKEATSKIKQKKKRKKTLVITLHDPYVHTEYRL